MTKCHIEAPIKVAPVPAKAAAPANNVVALTLADTTPKATNAPKISNDIGKMESNNRAVTAIIEFTTLLTSLIFPQYFILLNSLFFSYLIYC
jgi:hypothetical protein